MLRSNFSNRSYVQLLHQKYLCIFTFYSRFILDLAPLRQFINKLLLRSKSTRRQNVTSLLFGGGGGDTRTPADGPALCTNDGKASVMSFTSISCCLCCRRGVYSSDTVILKFLAVCLNVIEKPAGWKRAVNIVGPKPVKPAIRVWH